MLYLVFGLVLLILGMAGQLLAFSTLLASLVVTFSCLALAYWTRRSRAILLIDVWLFAYLYIYLSEFLLSREDVLFSFGTRIVEMSEGFIVAALGATLIGYWLMIQILQPRKGLPSSPATKGGFGKPQSSVFYRRHRKRRRAHPVVHAASSARTYNGGPNQTHESVASNPAPSKGIAETPPQPSTDVREPMSAGIELFAIVLILTVAFYIFVAVSVQQLLLVARSQRVLEVDVGLLRTFMQAAMVVLPAVSVFLIQRFQVSPWLKLALISTSAIAIFAAVAIGTRFLVGYQLVSVLYLLLRHPSLLSRQRLFFALMVAVFLVMGSQVQLNTRGSGIGNVETSETLVQAIQPDSLLKSEGILRINAYIHLRQAYSFADRLPENLYILYWWVPRVIWEDKPTMAGHWVIRELTYERVSEAHSASGGFAMAALLDFGPRGGVVFSVLYGLLIGAFEVYAWRRRNLRHPVAILIGSMYFAVFFMMRSLHTSLIFLTVASLVSVVPLSILMRPSGSRRTAKLHAPGYQMTGRTHKS